MYFKIDDLVDKLTISEEKVYQIMMDISKKKGEEQIAEVDKKGLWNADCITVELRDIAKAIKEGDIYE